MPLPSSNMSEGDILECDGALGDVVECVIAGDVERVLLNSSMFAQYIVQA